MDDKRDDVEALADLIVQTRQEEVEEEFFDKVLSKPLKTHFKKKKKGGKYVPTAMTPKEAAKLGETLMKQSRKRAVSKTDKGMEIDLRLYYGEESHDYNPYVNTKFTSIDGVNGLISGTRKSYSMSSIDKTIEEATLKWASKRGYKVEIVTNNEPIKGNI